MRTAEQMTFNIAAKIADIQPNGNIVLEARKSITQSDNKFEASLSGICRAEDIGPNNVILSRHIYDLRIDRQDSGHVRDGYSRGWLTKWYARLKPF
jgi:flagellar L-ring protein precursor FlgH